MEKACDSITSFAHGVFAAAAVGTEHAEGAEMEEKTNKIRDTRWP